MEALIPIVEAGKLLGIGRGTVFKMAKQSCFPIPVYRIGGKKLFVCPGDLRRFLEGERQPSPHGTTVL